MRRHIAQGENSPLSYDWVLSKWNARYILGIPIFMGSVSLLHEIIEDHFSEDVSAYFACINPHSYVLSRIFPDFRSALSNASLCVCDGIGTYGVFLLRTRSILLRRITGRTLLSIANTVAEEKKIPVIVIAPSEDSSLHIQECLAEQGIGVALAITPGYNSRIDSGWVIRKIEESGLRDVSCFIYIFIGAPKQEVLASQISKRMKRKVGICVGGVFDELLNQSASPKEVLWARTKVFASSVHVEWLARLINDPRRMWKRVFVSSFVFLFLLLTSLSSLPFKKFLRFLLSP